MEKAMQNILTGKNLAYLVEAREISKAFAQQTSVLKKSSQLIKAVDSVSFGIQAGTVLGIVGESGCGKTTLGRIMVNLLTPSSGSVYFEGKNITGISGKEMKQVRRNMQIIFQDPFSSLDPRMTVYEIVGEGLKNYGLVKNNKELYARVEELAAQCGLFPEQCNRYPHQFSGGQRQRICIARALATKPKFIVCDEAVSALDVSIQAQILNLLKDLQEGMELTYLFVSHDLKVVEFISDQVAVMYLGQIVEMGNTSYIFNSPLHPYTAALLSAAPAFTAEEKKVKKRIVLEGELPNAANPPGGCYFSSRCPIAEEACTKEKPPYREIRQGHFCACFKAN